MVTDTNRLVSFPTSQKWQYRLAALGGRGEPRSGGRTALLRIDVGRPDHLAPFLGLVGDELAEVHGRACEYRAAQVGKPRVELAIGKGGIDLLVELVDDLRRRLLGRADTEPSA